MQLKRAVLFNLSILCLLLDTVTLGLVEYVIHIYIYVYDLSGPFSRVSVYSSLKELMNWTF